MPTHEIWDTGVFRYIGAGDLALADIQQPGVTVCYTPALLLELTSRYTAGSFEHRKQTAQAILDSQATLLPDPETYLTRDVFGFSVNEAEFDWTHAVQAMAQSDTLEQLQAGVADFRTRVRRSVNLTFARTYREGLDRDFVEDMLTVQRREIPGFAAWWNPDPLQRTGQVPRVTGEARTRFLADSQTPQFTAAIIEACRDRALYKTNDSLPWPPTPAWVERLEEACGRLEFYAKVYRQYLVRLLAGGMLPDVNDWFDLEVLLYSSDDDHVVVTSDRRWESIARDAGMSHRVRRIRP